MLYFAIYKILFIFNLHVVDYFVLYKYKWFFILLIWFHAILIILEWHRLIVQYSAAAQWVSFFHSCLNLCKAQGVN